MLQDETITPESIPHANDETSRQSREGQLSLLGEHPLHQFRACVAICTLTSDALRDQLQQEESLQGILIGSLHTENLGIEHLITYTVSNPNIRYIIVCGEDGKQAVGHLPGQSFLSLVKNGLDEQGNIIGAKGKRPVIQNISRRAVEHFRRNVEVLDMIGCEDVRTIVAKAEECLARNPGLAETFEEETSETPVETVKGYSHEKMSLDPCGYFVIYVDRDRQLLVMEHYGNKGSLNLIIEGQTGPELYFPAIDRGLISRLDHAAYLGRELDRAELALKTGLEYVQDTKI